MNTNSEAYYIGECLALIEAKWQRGGREEWKSYDFERLNADIYEATGVSLSVSTLKRVFGKVSYTNLPSLHTLNTLARFAGYEDWNAFKRQTEAGASAAGSLPPRSAEALHKGEQAMPAATMPPTPPSAAAPVATPAPGRSTTPHRWWLLLLIPIALLGYSLLKKNARPAPPDPRSYSFTCDKIVTDGVPNSVVFRYNAPAAPTDSVFITQTWDMSRKTAVPQTGPQTGPAAAREFSAIYYYPGFFQAKLVIDTQIVRTQDLMIGSGGWLALATGDPIPTYFSKEEVRRTEGVEIDTATLARYHLIGQPRAPNTRLFYMKEMEGLSNADFSFETTLKNGFNQGAGVCQYVEVLIQCKEDIIIIPLAAKRCIGDLRLYAAGAGVSSRDADLSGFGCDLTQWTTLKVESRNRQMHFLVNGREAWSLRFPHAPTDIVGVQYRFTGVCAVRNARFTGGGHSFDLE